jgi:hypothetical protein
MKLKTILALLLAVAVPSSAMAHDIVQESNPKLKWNVKRAGYMPQDRQLPKGGRKPDEYVVVLANRWALNQQIRVCFYGGDTALRQRILSSGAEWFKYVNLKFDATQANDCAPGDRSEIRIGFTEPGYWSYIGTDSLNPNLVQKNLASMNFGGWDFQPIDEPRFSGVVLHEFGHALGFHHEHQSPGTDCGTEYDWDKLYAWYWDQYKWPKEKVDENLRPLMRDVSAYEWSTRDAGSIMVYTSNTQFLINGQASKCNFTENYVLSELDKQGAQRSYPAQGSKQQDRIDKLRHAVAMAPNPQQREQLVRQLQAVEQQATAK